VSEQTRQRVLRAAAELQYQPNAAARALGSRRTETIALVIPVIEDDQHYFHRLSHLKLSEVLSGIYSVAHHRDYRLLILMADQRFLHTRPYLRLWRGAAVDGIIWWSVPLDPDFLASGCPVVALNTRQDDVVHHYVIVDNRGGARRMVDHLVDLGHRRIGFIAGPDEFFDVRERLAGYCEAMAAHGLEPLIERGDLFPASGAQAVQRLLTRQPPPTAIFAANDLMAIGATCAAQALGYRIPEQLALVGADGLDQLDYFRPGISTLQTWMHRAAALATERLLGLVRGELTGQIAEVLPVDLVIRETCGYRQRYGTEVEGRRPGALVPPLERWRFPAVLFPTGSLAPRAAGNSPEAPDEA
jgi:DNA-binding LacI/PurR family transcriptional regulator